MAPNEIQKGAPTDPLDLLMSNSSSTGQEENTESPNPLQAPADFIMSSEEQANVSNAIKSMFDARDAEDETMADADDEESEVDLEDQKSRTRNLREILLPLTRLWWSGHQEMEQVTEKLADGSRDPKWRIPLGDSGIINFYLQLLSTEYLIHGLRIHILRLIGNSCADTDQNRARVVSSTSLSPIIFQLKDVSLLPFTIPVLYNICIDYEPAQKQASTLSLGKQLIGLIGGPTLNDNRAFLGYACKLLDLLIAHPSEVDLAPENSPIVLLKIASDREAPCDMEDYLALVNTSMAYLQYEKFQKALIAQGGLDTTLTVLIDSYTRFDSQPSIGYSGPDEDDAKALSEMRTKLNHTLSEVSALPEFKEACPVVSPFTSSLRRWLSSPQLQLQVCACIILGNLARSDAACVEFVHTSQVHNPLIAILTDAKDPQLLHSALGFLKNLALPLQNKELIGDAGVFEVLPRLWHLDNLQQVQFSSISLARQLVNGTFENVRNVCKRLTDDEDSPANMRTRLSFLIALFDRTDVEPVKMEISRLVTAICRVFNTYTGRPSEEMEVIRLKFFKMHPDIGRPLSFMVSQTKWPVVRSEGWFVFALMARYKDGAECISNLLNEVSVFQPLVELLTGKDLIDSKASASATSPTQLLLESQTPGHISSTPEPHAQAEEMARLDRENAVVLISEMLKNRGTDMAVMRRTLFEDLLKGGGELVMSYKDNGRQGDRVAKEKRIRANLSMQEVAVQAASELFE
ncbi:armadillo-type protein [Amylocarpus encephaloides]|uniref:Armadillo-type protein n=1 Tax=Amylocarpus encephaloides TaxID=45428 RepID=A0A9P7YEI2_9HELO|nr:armadillo-type protein [Amylocarpus encephaloides]